MKIVFIGASKFSLSCLEAIMNLSDVEVMGVITNSKKFKISYAQEGVTNVLYENLLKFSRDHALPCYLMQDKMSEKGLIDEVVGWNPDCFIVAGWYHMIPRSMRKIAPAFGLHASLLPDYSGGAPLVWAIINGEKKTGISLFQMDDGVDSGPILGQKEEDIREDDSIATLYQRIEKRGVELLEECLPKVAQGYLSLKEQDESKRRVFPQRFPDDGRVDWSWEQERIYNFVRAQTKPYPGAFTTLNGKKLFLWQVEMGGFDGGKSSQLGQVIGHEDACYIKCEQGTVLMRQVEFERIAYEGQEVGRLFGGGGQILGK